MPFYLKDRDISSDIGTVHSVLIVPCRFCPAASLAVREGKPYIELFRKFLRTPSYESYIQGLKSRLESEGIRTGVFDSKFPHQFVVCMWTSARRKELARQAAGYDALIVLGCDAAVETTRSCIKSNGCRIIPGMEVEGIMNVIPSLHFPFNIRLEVSSVTRVLQHHAGASPSRSQNEIIRPVAPPDRYFAALHNGS
jgi:hypothetical protein